MSEARRHFVYRAFDEFGHLLYIGCTQYPQQRWQQHERQSAWAKFARHFHVQGPYTYYVGFDVERAAITDEQPLFNLRWSTAHYVRNIDRIPAYRALREKAAAMGGASQ